LHDFKRAVIVVLANLPVFGFSSSAASPPAFAFGASDAEVVFYELSTYSNADATAGA